MTKSENEKRSFTMVDNAIVARRDVKAGDKLVLIGLLSFDWCIDGERKGVVWPSMDALAAATGMCRRTVLSAIERLEKARVITVERKKGCAHHYKLGALGIPAKVAESGNGTGADG